MPLIKGQIAANSAKSLMRSRYTAFAIKDAEYLLRSWHKSTRPPSLSFKDHEVTWLSLSILDSEKGRSSDSFGTVTFSAKYREDKDIYELREASEFIKEDGVWYYIKGLSKTVKIKQERNLPCACGSGIKFKKCCLKK